MFSVIVTILEAVLKAASFFWTTREEKLGKTEQKLADDETTLQAVREGITDNVKNENFSNADLADKLRS